MRIPKLAVLLFLTGLSFCSYADVNFLPNKSIEFAHDLPLAQNGNAVAQFNVGEIYEFGEGIHQNMQEALNWYRLAANQGNVGAQLRLADIHYFGPPALQDFQESIKWYRLAADQGNAVAQVRLAAMYTHGLGVPANYVVAYALFNVPPANDPSRKIFSFPFNDFLIKKMNAAEIDEAENLSKKLAVAGSFLSTLDTYLNAAHLKATN